VRSRTCFALAAACAALLVPSLASAHAERPVEFPPGIGSVPAYRTEGPYFVVCKPDTPDRIAALPSDLRAWNEALYRACREHGFAHIQAAVDAVPQPGWRILVQPGVYREEPSLAAPTGACADLQGKAILEYEEHVFCPHLQNLIAILGDDPEDPDRLCTTERLCRLQIEGTGAKPEDVLLDGDFHKLNVLRADRADGFYLRNVLVQKSLFNAVYVMEQDGFVIDHVVGRWNDEYAFLTFAVDHGLYEDCEGYGNGDSAVYPGSASDLHGARWSVEITRCNGHHNALGYSGTAGNSVWVHDNDFHDNAAGISMDSVFPGHPGLPQDSARFERNRVFDNNNDYFDNFLGPEAPCSKPIAERDWTGWGTVCPTPPIPVGTGILVAGGNHNTFASNWIYDNWRTGTMLFTVPAVFRNEMDPQKQLDTSHFNQYVGNVMGVAPDGTRFPNGVDFWWDEGGNGNCWQGNVDPGGVTSDPPPALLPSCDAIPLGHPPSPLKTGFLVPCGQYNRTSNHHPPGCDWMTAPAPLHDRADAPPVPPGLSSTPVSPAAAGAATRAAGLEAVLGWLALLGAAGIAARGRRRA